MAESLDKASASKIRQLFNSYDEDGAGTITISELKRGLKRNGIDCDDNELYRFMRKIDTDGDGRIDFTEFTTLYLKKTIQREEKGKKKKKAHLFAVKKTIPNQNELKARFRKADKDGNGSISIDELKETLGYSDDDDDDDEDDEWYKFMRLADENEDGEISFDEYVVAMIKLHLKD
ncbi:uncharacterized protein [Ptychodera flava]|uniref:uncharacterized protein n=1 Tax=Ptychodera flava TaxID=63121 RepID=UPI00396A5713